MSFCRANNSMSPAEVHQSQTLPLGLSQRRLKPSTSEKACKPWKWTSQLWGSYTVLACLVLPWLVLHIQTFHQKDSLYQDRPVLLTPSSMSFQVHQSFSFSYSSPPFSSLPLQTYYNHPASFFLQVQHLMK